MLERNAKEIQQIIDVCDDRISIMKSAINKYNEMYTTTDDPSDGFSNHWSNAPEYDECHKCPVCGETENLIDDTPKNEKTFRLYICLSCGEWFKI